MFTRGLTRWLKLPGLARSASSVWVTPRGVKPDIIGIQRAMPRLAHFLVHDWAARGELFEPVEAMFVSVGGELVAHPVTVGDRTDPVIRALLDERLWLWQLPVLAVTEPAVFPLPSKPGEDPGNKVARGFLDVRVIDEVGQPVAGAVLEVERNGAHTTNGAGRVRISGVTDASAIVRFRAEDSVRAELRSRWLVARGRPWVVAADLGDASFIEVRRADAFDTAVIYLDEPHTIVLTPRVLQVVMLGMWFETHKCFMLPSAIDGARFAVDVAKENPETDFLVVGHTDSTGQPGYNDPLSLERAKAGLAYLVRDVEAWYRFYGAGVMAEKRWGKHEDNLMIEAIAEAKEEALDPSESPVRWYQATRGLTVDGVAGSETRQALIAEYMGLSGAPLPADIRAAAHGCGESFPPKPSADGAAEPENRSIEIFVFENPIRPPGRPPAVLPPPPAEISRPGSKEYPEWLLRTRQRLEHRATWNPTPYSLVIAFEQELAEYLPDDLSFELTVEQRVVGVISWHDGTAADGRRQFMFQPVAPEEVSTLVAIFADQRVVLWEDQLVGPSSRAIAWKNTLVDLVSLPEIEEEVAEGTPMSEDWHAKYDEDGEEYVPGSSDEDLG